jgi:LytS/YehU family sensor histidine kinase
MNPHFTFNTISSIQNYILKKDKIEAILYLSDFALLIRKSLDFSFNDYITFNEEINFLKLYIELENKRFDSHFIFETNIDSSISANTNTLPSLLIQPLVENIILHANYKENKPKKILLSIKNLNRHYEIKITDYGSGIKHSKIISKHKSYGLEIIKNRLKIYNDQNHSPSDLTLEFTDKKKQTGNTTIIKLYKNEHNNN